MRRVTIVVMAVLMGVVLAPAAMAGETVTKMDASDGASDGHWIVLVAKLSAPDSQIGTIGAAVGNGEKFEGAFGMSVEGGQAKVSRLTHETLKAVRKSEKAPDTTTVIIMATEAQFTKAKAAIDKYSAMEEFLDTPLDTMLNCSSEVIAALGLRRPYRSGLSRPNPATWIGDVPKMNRDLIQE